MREIIIIAFTQLRQSLSNRGTLINIFFIPLLMVFFLGSAISGDAVATGQIYDVVRASDANDTLAQKFVDLLRAEGQKQYQGKDRFIVCDLAKPSEQPEACKLSSFNTGDDPEVFSKKRVQDGAAYTSIVVSSTFTHDIQSGKSAQITINTKGGGISAQSVQQQVGAVNSRLGGTIVAARVVTDKLAGDQEFYDKVYNAADSVWAKNPVQINEELSTTTGTQAGSGFGQSAPGIGAMWVMTIAFILAEVFIQERKQGTLYRLMMMPVRRWQILAGKLLGQYLLGLLTFAVLLVFGSFFGVRWGDTPAVIVLVLVYTLSVTAIGLLLSTIAKTEGQSNALRQLLTMTLAPLGGAWWTLAIVPQWMRQIGQISPIYWSQDAFTKLIFYGAHLPDIVPSLAVLLGFTVVAFALGIWRFRYE